MLDKPSNAYLGKDGGYALIAGNGDSIFKRLMAVIDRADPRRLAAASTHTHGNS